MAWVAVVGRAHLLAVHLPPVPRGAAEVVQHRARQAVWGQHPLHRARVPLVHDVAGVPVEVAPGPEPALRRSRVRGRDQRDVSLRSRTNGY